MKLNSLRYLGALALTAAATQGLAQTAPPDTIERSDVKTWVITVDGKDYEARPLTPTFSGSSGLFHMPSAYTLAKKEVGFSLFRYNWDRNPKDLDASTHGLNLAYGLSKRLEIFGAFGLQRNNVDKRNEPGYPNDFPRAGRQATSPGWQTGAGDALVGLKYALLDDYSGGGVGLAVRPTIKLPTASFDDGLGTGKVSLGIDLLLSKHLNRKAELHGMVGYKTNGDPAGFNLGNAFRWGLGFGVPVVSRFQIQAEVTGTKYSGGDFKQVNPVDFLIGPVIYISKGFFIRPAYSRNLNFTDGANPAGSASYSGMNISIGRAGAAAGREIFVPPPPPRPTPPPPVRVDNRPPTVSLDVDKTTAITCDTFRFRANASDPDGDTLTYAWTTTAGKIVGEGANVTLDPGCLPAGTEVTVTVTVNDGHGHSAQASRRVTIEAKAKPQTVTRSVGPFPKNSTRLNNIDKSVLDDMATRLRQDPASRLLIVGNAEKGERNPNVLSRRRAEVVKDYIVKQRGIDASRITTRGAGASGSRKADLTFVPDGADMPSM